MKESFIRTFTRTALRADFKPEDNVPILRTPVMNIFGPTVKEIATMSKIARLFEYCWYAFALLITGIVIVAGIILAIPASGKPEMSWAVGILFALIWLFSLVQFLSLTGYIRYRLRKQSSR